MYNIPSESDLTAVCSVSTGRRCDGYSSLPFSRRDLQAASSTTPKTLFDRQSHINGHKLRTDQQPRTPITVLPRLVNDPAFGDVRDKVLVTRHACPDVFSNSRKAILPTFQTTYDSKHKFPGGFSILESSPASNKPSRTGDQTCSTRFDLLAP